MATCFELHKRNKQLYIIIESPLRRELEFDLDVEGFTEFD